MRFGSRVCLGSVLFSIACVVSVFLISSLTNPKGEAAEPLSYRSSSHLRRQEECSLRDPCRFKVVADLDLSSREGLLFHSFILEGLLIYQKSKSVYEVRWSSPVRISSGLNDFNRGMELSELILAPNGALLSADDRTGIVYEHIVVDGVETVAPRFIISEGNGTSQKGAKLEWATIYNGDILFGSFGKEFTGSQGEVLHTHNVWVFHISPSGRVTRQDWTPIYTKIRKAIGAEFPTGYIIHEAVAWSPIQKRWYFLPRRISFEPYNETLDETKGTNMIISSDEFFNSFTIVSAGPHIPTRGFSSFKFVPGSHDKILFALRSEENAEENTQKTYATILTVDGKVLLEETEVPGPYKYEGLEFISSKK